MTFLLGLVVGLYYVRERRILLFMLAYPFMDIWSYGLSFFAV